METSSLQNNQPHLESVFGPLSADDDSKLRSIFRDVDQILLEIARHYGREEAGSDGTGLELTWMHSGQVAISSHVGSCTPKGGCVDFMLELRPSWYFGERSSLPTWDVEFSVTADCGHAEDHSYMRTVHEAVVRKESVIAAATEQFNAAQELRRLAKEFPLEHWLKLASDFEAPATK